MANIIDQKCLTPSPGWPGKIKFKCELWPETPTYQRSRQDQSFIFSPETLSIAPESMRNKISGVDGVDGIYLKPLPNVYISNYLTFRKAGPYIQTKQEEKNKDPYFDNIISLPNLEFLSPVRNLTSDDLVISFNNTALYSSSLASHQTWISDGSLYCSENVLPSERRSISRIFDTVTRIKKSYCAIWDYVTENVTSSVPNSSNGSDKVNYISYPYIVGTDKDGDPVAAIKANQAYDSFSDGFNIYKNINPGLHWRVIKRTPLFQGEDFCVEFVRKADQKSNSESSAARFYMLDKFSFLDVNQINLGSICSAVDQDGILDTDASKKINETTKQIFDLSRQKYYIIEIGVNDPNHNYFIIIAENSFPIFCHLGKSPYLECYAAGAEPDGEEQEDAPLTDKKDTKIPLCDNEEQTNQQTQETKSSPRYKKVVLNPKNKMLRRLNTFEAAHSSTLMQQERLKVNIRQHDDKIIITFSQYEKNPWIISRKDIASSSVSSPSKPSTENDITYESVRMIIPSAPIAIMGGGIKSGFIFNPCFYETLSAYTMPQNFSIEGPVNADEIQLLWRDKAKSLNPEISEFTKKAQYTNQASKYVEKTYFNELSFKTTNVETYANSVQRNFVKRFGKAPDMDYEGIKKSFSSGSLNSDYIFDITPASLEAYASVCAQPAGSTSKRVVNIQSTISMLPGDYIFKPIDDTSSNKLGWVAKGCITPIAYNLRLLVAPNGQSNNKERIDVSHHVLSFSDEWSETDFQKLEHTGNISFLISEGAKFNGTNYSNYLVSRLDKAFYLQISIWWEGGFMDTPSDERDRIAFTGLCVGGSISVENNRKVLNCTIYDYSKILKDQFFLNSPFFERMRDVNAVREILQLAGLRDGKDTGSSFAPGSLLSVLADGQEINGWYSFIFNGDKIYTREYALPGSYDMLQGQYMRFSDGESYWEAIDRISLLANKVAYFDRFGVFHFEALPYDQELFGGARGTFTNWSVINWLNLSKVDFFASPKSNVLLVQKSDIGRQIIGEYKIERLVSDVVNEIKIISSTPNGEILVAGHTNYASIDDPDNPGFLGYKKTFLQMDGIFGSESNVKWAVKNYTRMFTPPLKVSFKAIGRNNIKALDVVSFQPLGSKNKQPLIVSSVKNVINAEENTWFQDFECIWLYPRQDIEWGSTNEIGLGLDGSISGNIGG